MALQGSTEMNSKHNVSRDSLEPGVEDQPKEVCLFAQDARQSAAIAMARHEKYKLSNPGFFATFENQAEVYELLIHEEIHKVLFWLCRDNSFNDESDSSSVQGSSKRSDAVMKKPLLVSSFEVHSASNQKLFSKLFALSEDPNAEEGRDGLDLLTIKKVVGNSYTLCNFAAQEAKWEVAQQERRSQLQYKYLTMFLKMCAISIDGYQRDRYMSKIKEMTDDVEEAQK